MTIEFYQLFIIAIIIRFIPIIRIPFKMLSTYFHELGHGLMAIATFGKVEKIVLNLDGSGLCQYRYKSNFFRFFITLSGYIATSVFGYYIYYTAKTGTQMITPQTMYVVLGLIAISIVLWVRDFKTLLLVLSIAALLALPLAKENLFTYTSVYMALIGVYVMLDGVISPTHLIDGTNDGDGGTLHQMTGIHEGFWIVLWLVVAVYFLYEAYVL